MGSVLSWLRRWWGLVVAVFIAHVLAWATVGRTALDARWRRNGWARSNEARVTVGQIAKLAVRAYDRDGALCSSASEVPRDFAMVRGKKYLSTAEDWTRDGADAGFACLGFSADFPQQYAVSYSRLESDGGAQAFVVMARGDLDGNGKESRFTLWGGVVDGGARTAPSMAEEDPLE